MRGVSCLGVLVLAIAWLATLSFTDEAQGQAKAKYAIQEIMEKAHDDGLYKKVADGKADKKEMALLLELYTELAKNKPPKGTDASWKQKTGDLIAATKAVIDMKDKTAGAKLRNAAKCMDCHNIHKN